MPGWKQAISLLIAMLLIGLSPMMIGPAASQQDPHTIFTSKGCTMCHNNQVAPDWEGMLAKIRGWAAKYKSLDEAVRNEYTFQGGAKSYDEMMQQMKKFTPKISEDELETLKEYFEKVFSEGGAAPVQNQTQMQTSTAAPGKPSIRTVTYTPGAPGTPALIAASTLVAAIVVVLAAIFLVLVVSSPKYPR